ncbi:methyltransferase domain-containing protein [Apiospora kogelbergensis]|uniref:methyltransferase domain-containing protein n=1 Tax=Apiospora kogelbergensis TaxID=1337665 RepID=UPI00312FA8FE
MSAFARSTFSAKSYAAFRPSYPSVLYRAILSYHQLPTPAGTLLDLGCGHGLISRELSPHFASVTAVDPSAGMVSQAKKMTMSTDSSNNIQFQQGNAEDLAFVADKSLDMVVAGQAAHWFDYAKVWPNLARTLKPGGTQATEIMESFVYGFGEVAPGIEGMGSYWEPGRKILRNLLREVVPPESEFTDLKRQLHEPGQQGQGEDVAWQTNKMKLGAVEAYTRTFSCFNSWKDTYPDIKSRAEGGEGDVVDVMWDRMIDSVPEWKAMGDQWREVEVVSDWGTYLLMARRR